MSLAWHHLKWLLKFQYIWWNFKYKSPLWNLVLVSLMTVLKENSSSPSCPPLPHHTSEGVTMVTVIDRSLELFLMDNNITTCLVVFDQGWRFFHFTAYIYVPVSVPFLRVIIDTSELACASPELRVYNPVLMVGEQSGIQYRECGLVKTRYTDSTMQQCEFLCFDICPDTSMVNVGVQAEKLPWDFGGSGKICGVNVTSNWASD